ncbi:hypothetical protein M2105_002775 [Paenibacillus sp. PastF-1]|nr:hypothetical protein [Paenibacillus sp. PastF-2]MDF9848560.1 hypothetical protein [Paenibacillus sp. PastM-2]MDF9854918.1 hypothetical protein [Paenibacillus sp. PastF-1]MDH6480188.1 hypothetical protein [Paenibacillus sp. PastH-2]MDH6507828.1 hypothetical protein [Paenibacillus sp. PastM-3]
MKGGFPYLVVKDGDYLRNGELYLQNQFERVELDLKYIERTLPYVYQLWVENKKIHNVTFTTTYFKPYLDYDFLIVEASLPPSRVSKVTLTVAKEKDRVIRDNPTTADPIILYL